MTVTKIKTNLTPNKTIWLFGINGGNYHRPLYIQNQWFKKPTKTYQGPSKIFGQIANKSRYRETDILNKLSSLQTLFYYFR
jgi:hypothetical protein